MTITYLEGDRGAWDLEGSSGAGAHASDLAGLYPTYVHHVPAPDGTDTVLYSEDGISWAVVPLALLSVMVRETIFTFGGDLSIQDNPFRINNQFEARQRVKKVFLQTSGSPGGNSIKVDIRRNGVTIFTSGSYPEILAGDLTGYSVGIDDKIWEINDYLTTHILQVGSGPAGSNMVVHVIHDSRVIDTSTKKHAYLFGDLRTFAHAYFTSGSGYYACTNNLAYLEGINGAVSSVNAYLQGI